MAALLFLLLLLGGCRRAAEFREKVRERHLLEDLATLDPIDAHTHISATSPAFLAMLERLHMHVLDILYVDDTDLDRASLAKQQQNSLRFIASSNGRATLCTTFDPFRLTDSGFPESALDELNKDFAKGAVAVKVWKNIGMELKSPSGQYVMPDDPRFDLIYKDISAHNKTLIVHAADPDSAWDAQYPTSAGAKYYSAHPEWDMSQNPDAPRKQTILDARDHLLAANPKLRVIGAHLGSMENELDELANRFERYPNFAVDTAARVRSLTLQPRDKVRAFLLKYQDRILYGTDLSFDAGTTERAVVRKWENQYSLDWRYFATDDTFEYRGTKVEGLGLPRSVLKKLYHDNALSWVWGIRRNPR